MKYLIKSAKLISPGNTFHGKRIDIEIEGGKITNLGTKVNSPGAKTIESSDLHVSAGWIDMHSNFQDPGFEYKEDLSSGASAAAAGGFTRVCLSPLSQPIVDSKAQIEYLINRSKQGPVSLLPYGSISKKAQGKDLAELSDMHLAGAVAFTDDKRSVQNPNLLNRALLYVQAFDGLILNFPNTENLAYNGVMNEGEISTQTGLKGIPELAEDLMVARDLYLTEYTNGRIHFSYVSSARSLELIKAAKDKGLKVSCDVSAAHLLLDDSLLVEFDSRLKTMPPLRSKETVNALCKAVKKGLIDCISSDHWPEDIESKKREFDHAAFGMIGLQTAFPCAYTALEKTCSIEEIIALFTSGPARILGLETAPIEIGCEANLSLFDPSEFTVLEKDKVKSKSKNSPLFGRQLKGKVIAVINNKKLVQNEA